MGTSGILSPYLEPIVEKNLLNSFEMFWGLDSF